MNIVIIKIKFQLASWFCEGEEKNGNENYVDFIKQLRKSNSEKTFQNVLMYALSKSIKAYLTKRNLKVPEKMNVMIPRFASDKNYDTSELFKNHIDVMIIELPIENLQDFNLTESHIILSKALSNFNCAIVHPKVLDFLHDATPLSLIFSNLPGPNISINFGNYCVKNIVFYSVINGNPIFAIGSTSFNGKIGFGIIADKSTFQTTGDLNEILFEIVDEIKLMKEALGN